jgi:hypothetical protein
MKRNTTPSAPLQALTTAVGGLLHLSAAAPAWEQMRQALEALPLDTGSFAVALNRLNNARTYWEGGETGAAQFELRLLLAGVS